MPLTVVGVKAVPMFHSMGWHEAVQCPLGMPQLMAWGPSWGPFPIFDTAKQKGQSEDWPKCLFLMVRPERFERPTPWFVAKYSIQLSYGRTNIKDELYETSLSRSSVFLSLPDILNVGRWPQPRKRCRR